jgi:hypothetical protein
MEGLSKVRNGYAIQAQNRVDSGVWTNTLECPMGASAMEDPNELPVELWKAYVAYLNLTGRGSYRLVIISTYTKTEVL